jgi:hypothetical protein
MLTSGPGAVLDKTPARPPACHASPLGKLLNLNPGPPPPPHRRLPPTPTPAPGGSAPTSRRWRWALATTPRTSSPCCGVGGYARCTRPSRQSGAVVQPGQQAGAAVLGLAARLSTSRMRPNPPPHP